MPRTITSLDEIQDYLAGVMGRADHHAGNVTAAVLTLVGSILWMKDRGSIEVMEKEGETKNVAWVKFDGKRYAFSYNHKTGRVEVREKSTHGPVMLEVSNETDPADVLAFFRRIRPIAPS